MSWPLKSIGEFCKTGSGGTPSRKQEVKYYGGTIPWVKSGELRESVIFETEESITEAALTETSAKMIPAGALLVAMYGATVGRIATLGISATSNQAVCHIVPDDSIADQRYMFYALSKQVPKWLDQRVGGAQPNISQQIIRNTEIPLPPIAEQRRIAAILDKADAIRRKRKQAIQYTEELLRATFLDMFGDPVTNPKGWETKSLESISERIIDCPHSTPKWANEGIICLRTSNLTEGGWNWDDTRFVTEEDYKKRTSRSEILHRDIILSREGTVGIAAIVPSDLTLCMGQRLVQVRPDQRKITSSYLLRILLWQLAPERIGQLMRGSTSQHLNVKDLRSMRVRVPPILLQEQFSKISAQLEAQNQKLASSVKEKENLFNSLLQRAFQGELSA